MPDREGFGRREQLIFLTGLWLPDQEGEILRNSIGPVQNAANVFQNNILRGFDSVFGNRIAIVNAPFVGSFPAKYKKALFRRREYKRSDDQVLFDINVPFINLTGIKHFSRALGLLNGFKHEYRRLDKSVRIIVCGYAMTLSTVVALSVIKRQYPSVTTCLIIPDLPEYMNLGNRERIGVKYIKPFVNNFLYKLITLLDCFVVLTDEMAKRLGICDKPYEVVEGIAPEAIDINSHELASCKYIAYTGSLDSKYGVVDMVEGFLSADIPKDISLVICGDGDTANWIKAVSTKDDRVEYKGSVSNYESRRIQAGALFLINPRRNTEEYTKYSFPSKTLEYMVSGRPVLMFDLPGLPNEYKKHIFIIRESIKNEIESVVKISEEELTLFGYEAKKFVRESKNAEVQVYKIAKLLAITSGAAK